MSDSQNGPLGPPHEGIAQDDSAQASSPTTPSPARNDGSLPPVPHRAPGPILMPPPPKPTFGSSQPPVPPRGSGPIITPTLPNPPFGVSTPSPASSILPPGPVDSHTLTIFASSPGRIWTMHRNAYVVTSDTTTAYRLAQARLYPWIVSSGIAAYDEDATLRSATLYWLVDFVKKVEDVAGVEPPFLTLLYALRNSTDPQVKTTVQDALSTWKTFGKNAIGTHGSSTLFFYDVEKRNLLTLLDSTMDELREGLYVSSLDTLPSVLANVALRVNYDPFGRVNSPQTTQTVSAETRLALIQNHLIVQSDPADEPGLGPHPADPSTFPGRPVLKPSDPGYKGSEQEAQDQYDDSVYKLIGKIVAGATAVSKTLGPKFQKAIFESAEGDGLLGTLATSAEEIESVEGVLAVAEAAVEVVVVVGAAVTIGEVVAIITVAAGILAAVHEFIDDGHNLDAKTQLHSCNAQYPGTLPTLSLTGLTDPTPGTLNSEGPGSAGGGFAADGKPTLNTPVNGGSGSQGIHGGTSGQPGPGGPQGPIFGPPGSGSGHPTAPPGVESPTSGPGSQPTGQPIDDPDRPGLPDRPGSGGGGSEGGSSGGGQPVGPIDDPNTTRPNQPGPSDPNEPNGGSPAPQEPPNPIKEPTDPNDPPDDPDTTPEPAPTPTPTPKTTPPPPPPSPSPNPKTTPPDPPIDPNLPIASQGGGGGGGGGGSVIDPNTGRPVGPSIEAGGVPDEHGLPSDNPVKKG